MKKILFKIIPHLSSTSVIGRTLVLSLNIVMLKWKKKKWISKLNSEKCQEKPWKKASKNSGKPESLLCRLHPIFSGISGGAKDIKTKSDEDSSAENIRTKFIPWSDGSLGMHIFINRYS